MKIRNGFVSNSSSSSFVCDITGADYTAMDAGLEDAEMYTCEEGHTFVDEYLIGDPEGDFEQWHEDNDIDINEVEYKSPEWNKSVEIWGNYEGGRYEVPSKYCPLCQFNYIANSDIERYAFKQLGGKKKVEEEITSKFSSFQELKDYLKE